MKIIGSVRLPIKWKNFFGRDSFYFQKKVIGGERKGIKERAFSFLFP